MAEGREWFDRALGSPGGEDGNRGLACIDAGFLAFLQGADEEGSALFRQALELGRQIGDPTVTALALAPCFARIALRTDVHKRRGRSAERRSR